MCPPEPLSGVPLDGSAAWPGAAVERGVGRQARAVEGLAGCSKQSASCSSSVFFFPIQWNRAILTLHL